MKRLNVELLDRGLRFEEPNVLGLSAEAIFTGKEYQQMFAVNTSVQRKNMFLLIEGSLI